MTALPIRRLDREARSPLVAHFLALTPLDRSLRFGSAVSRDAIAAYVDRIDFDGGAVFAIEGHLRALIIGVVHVAFEAEVAELGLSVLPAYRGRGFGEALFERAAAYARNRSMSRLVLRDLSGNAPMLRIARRFGMEIERDGPDVDAYLALPAPTPASCIAECIRDVAAWNAGGRTWAVRPPFGAPRTGTRPLGSWR